MPYMRRLDNRTRRAAKNNTESYEPAKKYQESVKIESIKEPVPIPLPNEADITYNNNTTDPSSERSIPIFDSIRSLLKGRISLEDIVIAALIFILIQDGCCDELLLILMFYILLG